MSNQTEHSFNWTVFYQELADKVLTYKNNRQGLISILQEAYRNLQHFPFPFLERDGSSTGDMCPFSFFSTFNRGITNKNRIILLKSIADQLKIKADIPSSLEGIPVVNNQNAWYFRGKNDREPHDINTLWALFEAAIVYEKNPNETNRRSFAQYFNTVRQLPGVGDAKLTEGLFWIRPSFYLSMDSTNIAWMKKHTDIYDNQIIVDFNQSHAAGDYLRCIEMCKKSFDNSHNTTKSFPELSAAAYRDRSVLPPSKLGGTGSREKHYWLYAPGKKARKWEEYYKSGIMGIGWEEIGDLKQYETREEIIEAMKNHLDKEKSYKNDSLALWQFSGIPPEGIREGDVVFVKQGIKEIIGRGIVISDYQFMPDLAEYNHIRKVKWTHKGNWEHPGAAAMKTLTDITKYIDYVQNLEELVFTEGPEGGGGEIVDPPEVYEDYSPEEFLNEIFMETETYENLVKLLKRKKNIILQGSPGVGKTFAAKRLAYSMIGKKDTSRVMMIQFHQSYSYEDFIMGFRPTSTGGFELEKGPFYRFCKEAQDGIETEDYFFIIDEINRGNLSKIFGELLMLIEQDKRGEELRLLYANEKFSVPPNVYIIGLMNTADRSLAMIDYALRRRFAFFTMEPAFNSTGFRAIIDQADNSKFNTLVKEIQELNRDICQDESLGKGFEIGHSYFCPAENERIDDQWMRDIVDYEIIPLLNEYWFDDKIKFNEWSDRLHKAIK